MGSCWGTWHTSAGWWSPREPPWKSTCRCGAPSRQGCLPRSTSPSMDRSSSTRLSSSGFGSIGSLGSWWRSTRHYGWRESRRSSRGKRPSIQGCSSTMRRGSTIPEVLCSVRNACQSYGWGSCRIGRRWGCSSRSPPWHILVSTRRCWDLHDGRARSSPFPKRHDSWLGTTAGFRGSDGAFWSTWCMATAGGWIGGRLWSSRRGKLALPSWWTGCCRRLGGMELVHLRRCCLSNWHTFRRLSSYRPFLWPSRRRWRCSRSVRRRCD